MERYIDWIQPIAEVGTPNEPPPPPPEPEELVSPSGAPLLSLDGSPLYYQPR